MRACSSPRRTSLLRAGCEGEGFWVYGVGFWRIHGSDSRVGRQGRGVFSNETEAEVLGRLGPGASVAAGFTACFATHGAWLVVVSAVSPMPARCCDLLDAQLDGTVLGTKIMVVHLRT